MLLFFYWVAALLLYIVSLPLILYRQQKPRYRARIPAQYFLRNNRKFSKSGLWFHSCSLGETHGIKPIVDAFGGIVNISTVTNTGFEEANTLL